MLDELGFDLLIHASDNFLKKMRGQCGITLSTLL